MLNRFLLFPFLFPVLSGCTFHSSQLDAVRSIFSPPEVLPEHYWLLAFNEEVVPLVAVVNNPPNTSFVNADGISINHNGRDITFVGGWPEAETEIRISRVDHKLVHALSDGSSIEVSCSEWVLVTSQNWQLDCRSLGDLTWSYRNEVRIDEAGRIVSLHYAIWPGLSPIDLTWFPNSGEDQSVLPDI